MKRVMYFLCFFLLTLINLICGTMSGRIQFVATNCEGFAIALIILTQYKPRDFLKPIYLIWACISVIAGGIAMWWGINNYPYTGRWITAVLNIVLYGFIAIRVCTSLIARKRINVNVFAFLTWVILTIVMICSRNSRLWPAWYGLIFGCFFLTEYDAEDLRAMLRGLVNGVIAGFFVIQGFAFVFRPYDEYRYPGAFANPNLNALFYIIVYAALLCKMLSSIRQDKHIGISVLWFILAGAMFGFVTLCGSRTSYVAFAAVTVTFLICLYGLYQKIIKTFIVIPVALAIVAIISVPIDWAAARYLPAVHLHPIYWEGEWSEDKIQPGDSRDSAKYIELGEMLKNNVGRIAWFLDFDALFPEEHTDEISAVVEDEVEEVLEEEEPPYNEEDLLEHEGEDVGPIGLRFRLAKWYFSRLNLRGHDVDEESVWYSKDYCAPHAHNWLIMMSYSYGIPAGILFAVMLFFYLKAFIVLIKKKDIESAAVIGCFIAAFFAFGLFETTWSQGQMPFILFFILYRFVVDREYVWKRG